MAETIAVYGGSFDPPHIAHTLCCAYVLASERIDRALVVPAAAHPFGKPLAPFEHRVRMCELALRDLLRVTISRIEEELPKPSLTLRMLEELARREPGSRLRLVIGSDLLAETHAWHRFDRICELAPPIVVQRAGYVTEPAAPALPEISSTELRGRLARGESTSGWLDPLVAAYAEQHALYR